VLSTCWTRYSPNSGGAVEELTELSHHSGERHVLKLASSIAAGTPVSLSDAMTGIGRRNASLVVEAAAHASALSS
jgi:hypothetical protein